MLRLQKRVTQVLSLSIISVAISSCAMPAVQANKDALHKDMKIGSAVSNQMDKSRSRADLISFFDVSLDLKVHWFGRAILLTALIIILRKK